MRAKLLKQIRKRFDLKLVDSEYIYRDRKNGRYYFHPNFYSFINEIGDVLGRFYEFNRYVIQNRYKKNQIRLNEKFRP